MGLEIISKENTFIIKGALDKSNLEVFNSHFQHILNITDELIINIEKLESIDKYGVMALAKLHNEALAMHKDLSIIG